MKLIYLVIDGMGDLPIEELDDKTPLEAAYTPNMDFLAKKGKTGLMYTVRKGIAPESDVAVVSILGYDPFRYHVSRGVLEALGAGLDMKDGDLALRCNFATLGYGNRIVDRRVGRSLTGKEAAELAKALNKQVQSESVSASFHFKNTFGHRGVLIIRGNETKLSGNITNTDPAYSRTKGIGVAEPKPRMILNKCEPLDRTKEAKISADLVNEFTKKSVAILEEHEVNEKRIKERKPKANVILTRDAGDRIPRLPQLNEQYGLRFVCLADMPVERGISKLAGMYIVELNPPSKDFENDCKIRVERLFEKLPDYDCFYIHIKGPDEPGHDGDFKLKAQLIAEIDKHFIGKILHQIKMEEYIVCVTADHSTPCKLKAHSDDPVPLLISGSKISSDRTQKFSEKECKNGELGILPRGSDLMPKLMRYLKE